VRQSFAYGREFVSDGDLREQCDAWLSGIANARVHQTTKEVPVMRFERDERALLQPLADRSYRSLTLTPVLSPVAQQQRSSSAVLPRIDVEQRSLNAYARLAGRSTGVGPGASR